MFVVDTNILIYAADKDSPCHAKCRELILRWREQSTPWYLTWGIIYEFLRVVTHPRVFKCPLSSDSAWSFLEAVLEAPSLRMLSETERHQHVAREVFTELGTISGNLVFDAHTAILMRENGIKTIYTRDTDFNTFPFIDVIDPMSNIRRTTNRKPYD